MKEIYDGLRGGEDNAFTSAARVLLGVFILIIGVMTFFVPEFRVAFMGQLSGAGIPIQNQSLVIIPALEGVVGAMLVGGVLVRPASLVAALIMALLTYLHLVVADPALFPLQFGLPLIPIVGLVLSAFLYFVQSYEDLS